MILRDYQQTLFDEIHACIRSGIRNPLVCLGTGGGKTVIFSYMSNRASSQGNRVLILVHRRELVYQTSETLTNFGVSHGCIMPGITPNPMALVQVGMVQTISRRLERIKEPHLIIIDECHRVAGNTYTTVVNSFQRAVKVGFTATPERLDGKPLGAHFGKIIMGPSVEWMMQKGFLARPKYYTIPCRADLNVKKKGSDYDTEQLSVRMSAREVMGDVVDHYVKICKGSRAIAYCCNLEHAKNTMQSFRSAGIASDIIRGDMLNSARKQVIEDLASGKIKVLTSVDCISEGTDIPVVDVGILLRRTQSKSLHLQQVGRPLRAYEGKKAVILDHVGNLLTHGLAEDAREWSLDGIEKKKKGQKNEPATHTQCKQCYCMHPRKLTACPECGHVDEKRIRELKQIEGELIEIEAIKAAPLELALHDVRSAADIDKIRAAKGYKPGWAYFMKKKMGYLR